MQVSLYLTGLDKQRTAPLAVFTIPALAAAWTRLGVMVRGGNVKLFLDCEHVATVPVTRQTGQPCLTRPFHTLHYLSALYD